ncbi:MAG TPA: hypothetical protein DCS93_10930 [Microscillaceae bacterium]|nr:hypothetical protein [Microscillaceae bacterium]
MRNLLIPLSFLNMMLFQNCRSSNKTIVYKKETSQQVEADSLTGRSTKEQRKTEEGKKIDDGYQRYVANIIEAKKNPQNPFEKLTFTKAVLYQFKSGPESMFKEGTRDLIPMQDEKVLNMAQAREVITIVGDTSTYGQATASCFIPRHGVIFYDTQNKPVGHITICMGCNFLESFPYISAMHFHSVIEDFGNGQSVRPMKGFSKLGRKRLVAFFKKCGLKYPYDKHPLFDEE